MVHQLHQKMFGAFTLLRSFKKLLLKLTKSNQSYAEKVVNNLQCKIKTSWLLEKLNTTSEKQLVMKQQNHLLLECGMNSVASSLSMELKTLFHSAVVTSLETLESTLSSENPCSRLLPFQICSYSLSDLDLKTSCLKKKRQFWRKTSERSMESNIKRKRRAKK